MQILQQNLGSLAWIGEGDMASCLAGMNTANMGTLDDVIAHKPIKIGPIQVGTEKVLEFEGMKKLGATETLSKCKDRPLCIHHRAVSPSAVVLPIRMTRLLDTSSSTRTCTGRTTSLPSTWRSPAALDHDPVTIRYPRRSSSVLSEGLFDFQGRSGGEEGRGQEAKGGAPQLLHQLVSWSLEHAAVSRQSCGEVRPPLSLAHPRPRTSQGQQPRRPRKRRMRRQRRKRWTRRDSVPILWSPGSGSWQAGAEAPTIISKEADKDAGCSDMKGLCAHGNPGARAKCRIQCFRQSQRPRRLERSRAFGPQACASLRSFQF